MGGGHECCVPMCLSTSSTTKNITYFSFPSNQEVRRVWAKIISRRAKTGELWMPTSDNAKVCSLHFLETDFRYWANYRRLLPNALPSVFPQYPQKLRTRQAKIIELFRKDHPLGIVTYYSTKSTANSKVSNEADNEDDLGETTGKLSVSSQQTKEKSERTHGDTLLTEDLENNDTLSGDTKNEESEAKPPQDSVAPGNNTEGSKPFKKRRIESIPSCGDVSSKHNFDAERSEVHKNQAISSSSESESKHEKSRQSFGQGLDQHAEKRTLKIVPNSVKTQPLKNNQVGSSSDTGSFGRGKRTRKAPNRLDYNSTESRDAGVSESDEDYKADKKNSKRPLQILENGNSEESQAIRKIKSLQQSIRWKEEQLLNLNQKSVMERKLRIQAEKELEALKNSMKNNVSVDCNSVPVPSIMPSNKCNDEKLLVQNPELECERTVNISITNSGKSNLMERKNRENQESESKDQDSGSLNEKDIEGKNGNVNIRKASKAKNRFLNILKRILEDSMKGDAKALFLLEQIEKYGKDPATKFRMSTIKKCVEWKMLNARGYESIRNMDLLTLPSVTVLREHVDVMVETGVTAAEEVRLDSDLAELLEELSEDRLTSDLKSLRERNSVVKQSNQMKNFSSRTMGNDKTQKEELKNGIYGKKGKTLNQVMSSTSQPFKLNSSSCKPTEKIRSPDGNKSFKTPDNSIDSQVEDVERLTGSVEKRNANNSRTEKATDVEGEPDPTSENLVNAGSSDVEDAMDSEDYVEIEEAVVIEDDLADESMEPASEGMDPNYGAQIVESDSIEIKDESDELPPGCFIEDVEQSEDEDSN